jgi:hypothetical protein
LVVVTVGLALLSRACFAADRTLYVSPTGDDRAAGTEQSPFRTLHRVQEAVRTLNKGMTSDVVVSLSPGDYRLDRPLEFTEADSGHNGFHVIYRSAAGAGKARLLGSVPVKGWQPYRDGIWKVALPRDVLFHTLYENGQRVHKARWPDREFDPEKPTALGRYAVSVDGTPINSDKDPTPIKGPGWVGYSPDDVPPVTTITKMRMHIFGRGKCDWVREIHPVTTIDAKTRRITTSSVSTFGVGTGARYFLEDELGFLNVAGEFFVDEKTHALYYMPLGKGHPDTLAITRPLLSRMIQLQGKSPDACVENIVLDGLALEETDNSPPLPLWAYAGKRDGALVWMNNTARIEVRNCHLKNGGRSGIMMIGHNVQDLVTGCWIEHMGLNGISLCNKFQTPDKKAPTPDCCENNRIHNTHISHVGELHTYAECVTVFNVSNNEVDHCQLDNSVRYAITVRGNTGAQYGPPVWTQHPPCKGNRFHHIRVFRCGQDGGDMGALHAANLNNPGGGCVNTFDQITVADSAAIESMKDIPPDGIFLDWPKMSMDQVFRNIEIIRSQGRQIRSNRPENADSAVTENVSWKPDFREDLMDYDHIGLTSEFPVDFGGRPAGGTSLPAPAHLRAEAVSHDRVVLQWDAAACQGQPEYVVSRDGREIGRGGEARWVDRHLKENTSYRYSVASRAGDFTRCGEASRCEVTTPADRQPPVVTGVRVSPDGLRVRVAFNKPVDGKSAADPSGYRFEPVLHVRAVAQPDPDVVELSVEGWQSKTVYQLHVQGISDMAAARNRMIPGKPVAVSQFDTTVRYAMDSLSGSPRLEDSSGGGGHAVLRGGATIEAGVGPRSGSALVLDGRQGFAEAPNDLNLGPGDFTLAVWIYREKGGVIVSKGTDFGRPDQWSFGPSLRINNHYFSPAERAIRDRQWTHLAFVRQGNKGTSYVDGKPSGGPHDMSGIAPLVNDRPLRIGCREYDKNPVYFNGRISGLTIWPRALGAQEIREQAAGRPSE